VNNALGVRKNARCGGLVVSADSVSHLRKR